MTRRHLSQYTVYLIFSLRGLRMAISLQGRGEDGKEALSQAEEDLLDQYPEAKDVKWTHIHLTSGHDEDER